MPKWINSPTTAAVAHLHADTTLGLPRGVAAQTHLFVLFTNGFEKGGSQQIKQFKPKKCSRLLADRECDWGFLLRQTVQNCALTPASTARGGGPDEGEAMVCPPEAAVQAPEVMIVQRATANQQVNTSCVLPSVRPTGCASPSWQLNSSEALHQVSAKLFPRL